MLGDIMRDIRITEEEYRSSFTCASTSNDLAEQDENLPRQTIKPYHHCVPPTA